MKGLNKPTLIAALLVLCGSTWATATGYQSIRISNEPKNELAFYLRNQTEPATSIVRTSDGQVKLTAGGESFTLEEVIDALKTAEAYVPADSAAVPMFQYGETFMRVWISEGERLRHLADQADRQDADGRKVRKILNALVAWDKAQRLLK